MVEAENSSITGDLPSQSVPETYGAPTPDSLLRSKIDYQPLSSRPDRLAGWRKIVAGAAALSAVASGAGAPAIGQEPAFNSNLASIINPGISSESSSPILWIPGPDGAADLIPYHEEEVIPAGSICDVPQVKKFFKKYSEFADYGDEYAKARDQYNSGEEVTIPDSELIPILFKNPDGTSSLIKIPPCPPIEAEWYKTINEAQNAWVHGKIKLPDFRRFKYSGSTEPVPYNTNVINRDPFKEGEKGYYVFNGVFLGGKIIDNQIVFVMGFESKKHKKFTGAFRISSDINGKAELNQGEDSLDTPSKGLNITTAKEIYDRVLNHEGMAMFLQAQDFPATTGLGEEIDREVRTHLDETRDLHIALWDAANKDRMDFSRVKNCVNVDISEIDPMKLPVILYAFTKEKI